MRYLGDGDFVNFDKKSLKRFQEIESLPTEVKEKIYYFVDMAIRDTKAKQVYRY